MQATYLDVNSSEIQGIKATQKEGGDRVMLTPTLSRRRRGRMWAFQGRKGRQVEEGTTERREEVKRFEFRVAALHEEGFGAQEYETCSRIACGLVTPIKSPRSFFVPKSSHKRVR